MEASLAPAGSVRSKGLAVDINPERGRRAVMGVKHVHHQAAGALRHALFHAEQNRESVRTAAGPDIGRPGVSVGPGGLGVGLSHDKEPVFGKVVVALGREGELRVVAVLSPDLPEGLRLRSAAR